MVWLTASATSLTGGCPGPVGLGVTDRQGRGPAHDPGLAVDLDRQGGLGEACLHCWVGLYEIKGAAPPRQPAGSGRLTAGTPALRRWRAFAHPHRAPATPAGNPGSSLLNLTEAPNLRAADPTQEHPPDSGPRQGRLRRRCAMTFGHP